LKDIVEGYFKCDLRLLSNKYRYDLIFSHDLTLFACHFANKPHFKMMRSPGNSFLLLLLLVGSLVEATIAQWLDANGKVTCSIVTTRTSKFQVCATTGFSWLDEWYNETHQYRGGEGAAYRIVRGVAEGTDVTGLTNEEQQKAFRAGIKIELTSFEGVYDKNGAIGCGVFVTLSNATNTRTLQCTSCSYCLSGGYSADCTNLAHGRNVTCEPTEPGVFFPFKAGLLHHLRRPKPPQQTKKPPVTAPAKATRPASPTKMVRRL
jgi:hypothetical protein